MRTVLAAIELAGLLVVLVGGGILVVAVVVSFINRIGNPYDQW